MVLNSHSYFTVRVVMALSWLHISRCIICICQTNIIVFPYAEVREEETIGEEAHQDLKKLADQGVQLDVCWMNMARATLVVFPYLEVRETERIVDQLYHKTQELAWTPGRLSSIWFCYFRNNLFLFLLSALQGFWTSALEHLLLFNTLEEFQP